MAAVSEGVSRQPSDLRRRVNEPLDELRGPLRHGAAASVSDGPSLAVNCLSTSHRGREKQTSKSRLENGRFRTKVRFVTKTAEEPSLKEWSFVRSQSNDRQL